MSTSPLPSKTTGLTASFITLGCAKNRVDSELAIGKLQKAGCTIVPPEDPSDIRIINTCTFIRSAKEESIQVILEAAADKQRSHIKKIVILGCLVQRYRDELAAALPEVDLFFGTSGFDDLLGVLALEQRKVTVLEPDNPYDELSPRSNSLSPYSAYVKISEGCSKRCSFCIIPQIRGSLRSRQPENIVEEVRHLVQSGIKEIILISQETTSYGRDLGRQDATLPNLLAALSAIEGLAWIRLLYLHPDDLNIGMLEQLLNYPKVCRYFDIPVQHIDDTVLASMRRKKRATELSELFAWLKNQKDIFLRTSAIVGHPGESRAQFLALRTFLEEQQFHYLALFPYSDEEGTHSAELSRKVSKATIDKRYQEIWELKESIAGKRFKDLVGTTQECLIEKVSDESEHLLQGRIRGQAPESDGSLYITKGKAEPGQIRKVRITRAHGYDLIGEVL